MYYVFIFPWYGVYSLAQSNMNMCLLTGPYVLLYKVYCSHNVNNFKSRMQIDMTSTDTIYPQWFRSTTCNDHRLCIMKLFVRCKMFYSFKWKRNDLRDSALIRFGLKRKHNERNTLNDKVFSETSTCLVILKNWCLTYRKNCKNVTYTG